MKGVWEERFERAYGFWRGFLDDVVYAFLGCGDFQGGFARVFCDSRKSEYLVAFSGSRRGFCPSCAAKRAAISGALLREEILEEVAHAMWTFCIPKILRRYFLSGRKLLGALAQAAWETVSELMAQAAQAEGFRPGMVTALQSANDDLTWSPHVHGIASRGGWDSKSRWIPIPYVDTLAAEKLFRHKVFSLLGKKGLLCDERIELMFSWRFSGFSVHNSVTATPEDPEGIEPMARYLLHAPLSLDRMTLDEDTGNVGYRSKHNRSMGSQGESYDPLDFLARLLMHIPEPRLHLMRYVGAYSSVSRSRRRSGSEDEQALDVTVAVDEPSPEEAPCAAERRRLRRQWARMLRRIFEVDPLLCDCGEKMRILSFITCPSAIRKILNHLDSKARNRGRDPPGSGSSREEPAS